MIQSIGVSEHSNWVEEIRNRVPNETDLRNIQEMQSTGWTPTTIASGLELKFETVRKVLKNLPKPANETAEQKIDREMLGRVR